MDIVTTQIVEGKCGVIRMIRVEPASNAEFHWGIDALIESMSLKWIPSSNYSSFLIHQVDEISKVKTF